MVCVSACPGRSLGTSPSFSTNVSACGHPGTGPFAKVQYRVLIMAHSPFGAAGGRILDGNIDSSVAMWVTALDYVVRWCDDIAHWPCEKTNGGKGHLPHGRRLLATAVAPHMAVEMLRRRGPSGPCQEQP